MSTSTIDHGHDHAAPGHDHAHDHAHDHPTGLKRWVFATNHKDIGTLYLWFSFAMLLSGGVLALMIRTELFCWIYLRAATISAGWTMFCSGLFDQLLRV